MRQVELELLLQASDEDRRRIIWSMSPMDAMKYDAAFEVLQIEDYEWVTTRRAGLRDAAYELVDARFGYPKSQQHYLAGFVADAGQRDQWPEVIDAALDADKRGCAEVFLWALPQVL